MLVLGRFEGESIIIRGDITVTIIEARDGKARIAIDAPKSITVNRSEIEEAKKQGRAKK